jgi:hypothetical protein
VRDFNAKAEPKKLIIPVLPSHEISETLTSREDRSKKGHYFDKWPE